MFIIFGFGKKTRNIYDNVIYNNCDNCNNEKMWNYYEVTSWFTLFFIPLIPYSTERFLLCPICEHGFEIKDKKEGDIFKQLSNLHKSFSSNEISQEQYKEKYRELTGQLNS